MSIFDPVVFSQQCLDAFWAATSEDHKLQEPSYTPTCFPPCEEENAICSSGGLITVCTEGMTMVMKCEKVCEAKGMEYSGVCANEYQGQTSDTGFDVSGNFVVVWIDERNGNRDIYFQRFTSTGTPLGANTIVNNDATNADQISPSISMDATGNFVIAWQDFRNSNWDIYFQRFTDTGTTSGINTKVNDDAGNDFQYYPSISMDGIGDFVVIWQDFRNSNWDIYFQRYTNTGTTLGNNVKVNDDAGTAYQKVPTISREAAGDFVIVWEDYRNGQTNSDIFGQRYFSNGNTNGTNYSIVADGPNNGEATPVICANNSDIIFSWQDNRRSQGWDIYAKIVNWNWNGVTDVYNDDNDIPNEFYLYQNYPNPFNPSTTIRWQQPETSFVTLRIYDALGRESTTLVNEELSAGKHKIIFNASSLSSGIYFYQLQAGEFIETKKMILLK